LRTALEASLKSWYSERSQVQFDSMERAITDSKAGAKSEDLVKLEEREKELNRLINDAEEKLGSVTHRIGSKQFNATVNQILNNAKS
jgi:hypothetical protein